MKEHRHNWREYASINEVNLLFFSIGLNEEHGRVCLRCGKKIVYEKNIGISL